jgi:hypothetical protein
MERHKIASEYSSNFLETDRPQPLTDRRIESLIKSVTSGKMDVDLTNKLYDDFKIYATDYIVNGQLNTLVGLDKFERVDIINGCTQYIDSLYIKTKLQVLEGDYRYHKRLDPNLKYSKPNKLKENIPLILSMPFPSIGKPRDDMDNILNECVSKDIDVHIDGAWITASRAVEFDFSHTAIKSVGISLSKGLGLGWNRIGLRWTRKYDETDPICLMNDYHMNNRALVIIGNYFLLNLPKDYLWTEHVNRYFKICDDFDLEPTQSIHIAMRNKQPVGVSPLIRYLEENGI